MAHLLSALLDLDCHNSTADQHTVEVTFTPAADRMQGWANPVFHAGVRRLLHLVAEDVQKDGQLVLCVVSVPASTRGRGGHAQFVGVESIAVVSTRTTAEPLVPQRGRQPGL